MSAAPKKKDDPLSKKTFEFAVRMVNLNRYLTEEKKEYAISRQIIRSGTNPGAMIREAVYSESGLDFIHKLSIAQKETKETQYWLELLYATNFINEKAFNSLHAETDEILRLLTSSIKTKKKNMANKTAPVVLLFIIGIISLLT